MFEFRPPVLCPRHGLLGARETLALRLPAKGVRIAASKLGIFEAKSASTSAEVLRDFTLAVIALPVPRGEILGRSEAIQDVDIEITGFRRKSKLLNLLVNKYFKGIVPESAAGLGRIAYPAFSAHNRSGPLGRAIEWVAVLGRSTAGFSVGLAYFALHLRRSEDSLRIDWRKQGPTG